MFPINNSMDISFLNLRDAKNMIVCTFRPWIILDPRFDLYTTLCVCVLICKLHNVRKNVCAKNVIFGFLIFSF